MKIHKMISIDFELADKLKGENVSGLVNDLLHKHVNDEGWKKLKGKELTDAIAKEEARLEYEAKLSEIENGQA